MGRPARNFPAAIELGARVRSERRQLGWSQMELGEAAGLYFSVISEIELGRRNLTLATILKVANALGVNPAVLVDGLEP